jgi:hypothetical protein
MTLRPSAFCLLWYLCLASVTLTFGTGAVQERAYSQIKFKWDGSGKTMKKGAMEVSFSRYKSEKGVSVERFVESYRTLEVARAELEKLCRRASRVDRDGYKEDATGKRTGRRVELFFARSSAAPEHTVVAWTDGSNLVLLRSESRPVLLDFEHQDYPEAPVRNTPSKP